MRNFEEVTSWLHEDMPAAEQRPITGLSDASRVAAGTTRGAEDILGGAYGASWRESPEILFALKVAAGGVVFDAINPACEKSLGLANADVVGRSPTNILPTAAAGAFVVGCLQCAASAKTTRFTHAMALESRRRRWDTMLTPVCDEAGGVFLILGRSREVAASTAHARPSHVAAGIDSNASHAHALTIDRHWRVAAVSPTAREWMGMGEADIVGHDFRRALKYSSALLGAIDAALAIGQPSRLVSRSLFRPGRWVDFQIEPTDAGATLSFRDVTSEASSHDEAHVAGVAEYAPGGDSVEMALLDANGLILSVNAAWREVLGRPQSSGPTFGIGAPYEDVCRQIIPDLDPRALHEAMRQLLTREVHTLTHAYVVVTAAGPRWRQVRILPLKDDVAHFIAVHEDLTEVARNQAARRGASDELASAQEEERQRIAGDLHDSTGQHLAALGMAMARLRRLMRSRPDAQGIIDDMAASIDEAAKEIRVMSYLMKPASLHRDGLEATARRHVREFGIRTALAAVFRSEGPLDGVSPLVQHAAFRVVQEALSNVHRHARASGVEVELAARDEVLTLRIADDGRGIAPQRRARLEGIPPGVGIAGMRSRVEHLGGWFDIASSHAGTVVSATIPLPEPARASKAARR